MRQILRELKNHAPFTAFGAITGIVLIVVIILFNVLSQVSRISSIIFYILHPAHVVLSAIATTAMYKLNRTDFKLLWGIIIGYTGSIVIATLSDSLIPYLGELLLNLPNKGIHIGLIEEPLIINGAAFLGILIALLVPKTKFSHSGHVLLSTWASLFHILMAIGQTVSLIIIFPIFLFLFLAVWVPCCLSDIIFPLLFVPVKETREK
ncbi:MAG: hypothetical protein HQ555_08215 [Candidatus Aminicenantes bacterium]|nr:hypothetical protein [Candidatus Aminicenantes bacterium]